MKVLSIAAIALVALHFHLLFVFPQTFRVDWIFGRTWGFDFVRFFGVHWQAGFYLAMLGLCLPSLSARFSRLVLAVLDQIIPWMETHGKHLWFLFIALLSIPFFILLTSKYAFLGDSHLRSADAVAGTIRREQFLSLLLFHWVYKIFHTRFHVDGVLAIKLCAWAAGALFVYFSLKTADALGKSPGQKALFFAFLAFGGYAEQFCGYIEEYAVGLLFVLIYLYSALLVLHGKLRLVWPALILLLGALFHFGLLLYFPSFFILIYLLHLKDLPLFRKPVFWAAFVFCGALLFYFFAYKPMLPRLYPVFSIPGSSRMSMFSLRHFWEYGNSLVVSSGPALIVIIFSAIVMVWQRLKPTANLIFLGLTIAPPMAGVFILDTCLGCRDWDVFSFAAIGINLLAASVLLFVLQQEKISQTIRRYVLTFFCGILILHTLSWVFLCASDRSIPRLKDAMLDDPASYYPDHPAPMVLAIIFSNNKLDKDAMEMYALAYQKFPEDPRNGFNYASQLVQNGRMREASPVLNDLFERFPAYPLPLRLLFQAYASNGNQEMALKVLERFLELAQSNPDKLKPYYSSAEVAGYLTQLEQYYTGNRRPVDAAKVRQVLTVFQ